MQPVFFDSRADWTQKADALGLNLALLCHPPYWVEALANPFCLRFDIAQIQQIQKATAEISYMCAVLLDRVIFSEQSTELMLGLSIPEEFHELIRQSHSQVENSLYGRLDLALTAGGIKLLELNFDTPTALPECAMLQLTWLADMRQQGLLPEAADQYNFLQENIMQFFANTEVVQNALHFAYYPGATSDGETVKYLAQCARSSGLTATTLTLDQIKIHDGRLVDADNSPIKWLFKLYPWELIFEDEARIKASTGGHLFTKLLESTQLTMVEPCFKAVFASKAFLALLYQMFPSSPFLLPTYFENDRDKLGNDFVSKPFFGREGAGVVIHLAGQTIQNEEFYGLHADSPAHFIYQEYTSLPQVDHYTLVVGSWIVNNQPAGIGIRGDKSKITGQQSIFVPHFVV